MTDEEMPMSPFAKYAGEIKLGNTVVDCYVLDTYERVLSLRAVVKAISGTDGGALDSYIGVNVLKPYLDKDAILAETREFGIPGTQLLGKGITAERFLEIMGAYVTALSESMRGGPALTDRQRDIAIGCSVYVNSFAKLGLLALIDEVTGYQYDRERDALQVKLQAFVAEELRDWEKTFPDELWEEFGRLTNWKGSLHSRPKWWGKLVMELIYEALDPEIAEHLKTHKPPPMHGKNYHQWLTQDVGLKALITHIHQIIGMAKHCESMAELREAVAENYGREMVQLRLSIPRRSRPPKK